MLPLPPLASFNLRNSDSEGNELNVVRFTLSRKVVNPGDAIRGHLDFSHRQVPCYRVAITLRGVESVESGTPNQVSTVSATRTFWDFHEYCLNTESTHFLFSLPDKAVPTLSTDIGMYTYGFPSCQLLSLISLQNFSTWWKTNGIILISYTIFIYLSTLIPQTKASWSWVLQFKFIIGRAEAMRPASGVNTGNLQGIAPSPIPPKGSTECLEWELPIQVTVAPPSEEDGAAVSIDKTYGQFHHSEER